MATKRKRANPAIPVIHIYRQAPGEWHYSIVYSLTGEDPKRAGGHYGHHFDKTFATSAEARDHALEHIGSPGYGGESGTVLNWRRAKVKVHRYGWEPAGSYSSNPARKRNAGARTASHTATRTATSTKATTTGNKTGTSTGGAVSGGGGNITVSVKRNPPAGFIPCKAVKITRNRGRVEVRIKR